MREIKKIFVVGVGQLGTGIAQVALQSGFGAVIVDAVPEVMERARLNIEKALDRQVSKGKMDDSLKNRLMSNLSAATKLEAAKDCDAVIEAVFEDITLKQEVIGKLDKICLPDVLIGTNTSAIPITKLASGTSHPERVIGLHFTHPVAVIKLFEIIRGLRTSDEAYDSARKLGEAMGRYIVTSKDFPGFIGTRTAIPMWNEAIYALHEGVGTVEEIDKATRYGGKMGIFELLDFVGLDTVLHILQTLFEEYGQRFLPCPLLKQMVAANFLGQKSGIGFYNYTTSGDKVVNSALENKS